MIAQVRHVVTELQTDSTITDRIGIIVPLHFRQTRVWCRPDAGEWASFVVRGTHRRHFVFETQLARVR